MSDFWLQFFLKLLFIIFVTRIVIAKSIILINSYRKLLQIQLYCTIRT